MTKFTKVSAVFWRGRGLTVLHNFAVLFMILNTVFIFLFGIQKLEVGNSYLTYITVLYVFLAMDLSVINTMHPVLPVQNHESSWLSPEKPSDYIALIPVSRKNIIDSYIHYINYTCIIIFTAMAGFAFLSIENIFTTPVCAAGNVMFIWISFLIPVKDKKILTTKLTGSISEAVNFIIFFIASAVIATLFKNENHAVSVVSGVLSLIAEARAVIMLKRYQKKLLDTASDYSLTGETIGKEVSSQETAKESAD